MKYEITRIELSDLKKTLDLNEKIYNLIEGKDKADYKVIKHKSAIIEIYTFWENFIKQLVYDCYYEYKNLIVDERFLINYFRNIHEKSHTRDIFKNNFDNGKIEISKESLCFSNNMSFKEMKNIFKRIGFNVEDILKHLSDNPDLQTTINNLNNIGVIPVVEDEEGNDGTERHTKRNTNLFESYINLLVEDRNAVAHQRDIQIVYNSCQLNELYNFVKVICEAVYEYSFSQLIIKSKQKRKPASISNTFYPIAVYSENTGSNNSIIGIRNMSSHTISKDSEFYCFDDEKKLYRTLKIMECRHDGKTLSNFLNPYQDYSIKVKTLAPIRKQRPIFFISTAKNIEYDFEYLIHI